MSARAGRPRYGFEAAADVRSEPDDVEVDELAELVREITRLFQRDYILLATFLRALTR
ncbi:hypothetical protein [Pseudovibrio sp. FO-BEG1]|uniref:hypothetical protein n=1 Tax=Pseudovibrio sp. (strain FO-BEG1) TaxID=911045 RepID=UPI0002D82120|nr:hypothetical protein [Pseudovibrio sp. FO-BEG1]